MNKRTRIPRSPSNLRGRFAMALAMAATLAAGFSCKGNEPRERSDFVLGTACTIRLIEGGDGKALDAVFKRLRDIEATMSANADSSIVAAINAQAGARPVLVPADLAYVTKKSLFYAAKSEGAFDPTIGSIVRLWNIGLDEERLPSPEEISSRLPLVNYRDLTVDEKAGTIFLKRPGMRMDLGAIAKGYAADEATRILLERGTKAAVIDLGGNIKVLGSKPDGKPWQIGIQNPFDLRGNHIGVARLQGTATVVTSGVYERFFVAEDGKSYHHILNPKDGYPVRNGLVSVTIISASSIDADGLSTTLFALGLERGLAFAESMPGVSAIFIDDKKNVYLSAGTEAVFSLSDESFTVRRLE